MVWLEGPRDAHFAMIPKADGDAAPLGQRPLCILHVVCWRWASVRLAHRGDWFASWVPRSVFSAGRRGVVLVLLRHWFSTALDIEESLSGIVC